MRTLNRDGRLRYQNWVLTLNTSSAESPPKEILTDDTFSYDLNPLISMPIIRFSSKYELAVTVFQIVKQIEGAGLHSDVWPSIWDSLALFYFDSICRRDQSGLWRPYAGTEYYVYNSDYKFRHRHRIYGPITLFRNGGENLRPFFSCPPSQHGEFEEQIGSRQELAGNSQVLSVLRALYSNNGSGKLVPGYQSNKKFEGVSKKLPSPGSLRRFVEVSRQLKRTYDLGGISAEQYLSILPPEFNRWIERNKT